MLDPNDPKLSPTARASARNFQAQRNGTAPPTAGQQFMKWAQEPIGLPSRPMKTPQQVTSAQPASRPGVQAPAPAPAPAPALSPANFGVQGDASKYRVEGSQLVSARQPEAIQADIQAHPPMTTAAGQALLKPAAPAAAMPSVGVQGAAPAQATAAMPGVQMDPARAALHAGLRQAQADAASYGQGQWVFPPGTGTDPVWQPNTAHERIAGFTNALANHNQADPAAKVATLRGIAHSDPATRAFGAASMGVDPAAAAAMPQPGAQIDPASGQDINGWLAMNKDMPLHGKLAAVPHAPSPMVRDALQRHIDSEYSAPGSWEAEASQLPGLGDYQYHGIAPSFLSGASNIASYLWDRTPFGGQERNANPELIGLMKKHGLRPPGVNMPSSQQGIGNPN